MSKMHNRRNYARIEYRGVNGKREHLWLVTDRGRGSKAGLPLPGSSPYEEQGAGGAGMTFAELADFYQKTYLVPAQYVDGRKVAGRRSLEGVVAQVKSCRAWFGERLLRSITYGDLVRFRADRFNAPCQHSGKQRALSTVNRELTMLKHILNIGIQEDWLAKNPFNMGPPLICLANETKRKVITSKEQEALLLKMCDAHLTFSYKRFRRHITARDNGIARRRLRALIIAAIDTGMRRGELLKLEWQDVDLAGGIINILAFNTKTLRERQVSITSRLAAELRRLSSQARKDPKALVFGLISNFRKSWLTIVKLAGLSGLHFHDLRHTHASRLDGLGFSLPKIGTQLGHTQVSTTLRYINQNLDDVAEVAKALDAFNSSSGQKAVQSQKSEWPLALPPSGSEASDRRQGKIASGPIDAPRDHANG